MRRVAKLLKMKNLKIYAPCWASPDTSFSSSCSWRSVGRRDSWGNTSGLLASIEVKHSWSGTTRLGKDRSRKESSRHRKSKSENFHLLSQFLWPSLKSHLSTQAISFLIGIDCIVWNSPSDLLLHGLSSLATWLSSAGLALLLLLLPCDSASCSLFHTRNGCLGGWNWLLALKFRKIVRISQSSDEIVNLPLMVPLLRQLRDVRRQRLCLCEFALLVSLPYQVHCHYHHCWCYFPTRCC